MTEYDCVSLLTDYGLDDGFVAACHGVIMARAPSVRIVDVTHLVPPHDVRRGAAVLAQVVPYLPPAVHVAVVDPGVGTNRRPVAVAAGTGVLVGPDNGLLLDAANALGGVRAAVALTVPAGIPATFHGRDVFAPAAGSLAVGVGLHALGTAVDPTGLVRLPAPLCRRVGDRVETEVLSVDRFGNAQLAAGPDLLAAIGLTLGELVEVTVAERTVPAPYGATFADVPPGRPVAYVDSAGLVALAVNRGRAADVLGLSPGRPVRLRRG